MGARDVVRLTYLQPEIQLIAVSGPGLTRATPASYQSSSSTSRAAMALSGLSIPFALTMVFAVAFAKKFVRVVSSNLVVPLKVTGTPRMVKPGSTALASSGPRRVTSLASTERDTMRVAVICLGPLLNPSTKPHPRGDTAEGTAVSQHRDAENGK